VIAPAVAVALFAGACGGSSGPTTGGIPRSFYGIDPSTELGPPDYQRMGAARVGSLRFLIPWPSVQTTRGGPFNFTIADSIVAGAASQHIDLLPILDGTPAFETGGCATSLCSSQIRIDTALQRKDWSSFVRAFVERYGPHGSFWAASPDVPYDPIMRWQIWNEQNNPNQENPPKLYAKLLALTDPVVHSVDPKAEIVTGGMFGSPPHEPGRGGVTAWSYLDLLYKYGAGEHFDAVALHPYSPNDAGLAFQIKKIRSVLRARHHASVPILITEIGWGSSKKRFPGTGSRGQVFNVGLEQQKKKLQSSFRLLTSHRRSWRIGGVFWFTWKDPFQPPPGLCAFCYTAGLYKSDGTTAKPALGAYKSFTRKTK
jgi:hypothetical protein